MKHIIGLVVAATVFLVVVAEVLPHIAHAVRVLLIPAVVGVVLYLAVRIVHTYLNRW
jgi:hypothetical protein